MEDTKTKIIFTCLGCNKKKEYNGYNFCPKCGILVIMESLKCANCASLVSLEENKCANCNKELEVVKAKKTKGISKKIEIFTSLDQVFQNYFDFSLNYILEEFHGLLDYYPTIIKLIEKKINEAYFTHFGFGNEETTIQTLEKVKEVFEKKDVLINDVYEWMTILFSLYIYFFIENSQKYDKKLESIFEEIVEIAFEKIGILIEENMEVRKKLIVPITDVITIEKYLYENTLVLVLVLLSIRKDVKDYYISLKGSEIFFKLALFEEELRKIDVESKNENREKYYLIAFELLINIISFYLEKRERSAEKEVLVFLIAFYEKAKHIKEEKIVIYPFLIQLSKIIKDYTRSFYIRKDFDNLVRPIGRDYLNEEQIMMVVLMINIFYAFIDREDFLACRECFQNLWFIQKSIVMYNLKLFTFSKISILPQLYELLPFWYYKHCYEKTIHLSSYIADILQRFFYNEDSLFKAGFKDQVIKGLHKNYERTNNNDLLLIIKYIKNL